MLTTIVHRRRRSIGSSSRTAILITCALLCLHANAGPIFQDSLANQPDGMIGATRGTLPATSSIQTTGPFTASSDAFVRANIPSATSGAVNIVTYTPHSEANSWRALVGAPIVLGGVSYLNLNGALDVFVSPTATEVRSTVPGQMSTAWFRPVDIGMGFPLRIIFNGDDSGTIKLQFKTATPALGDQPGTFSQADSFALPNPINAIPNPFAIDAVTHLGVTLNTDSASGQITVKVFSVTSPVSIDTSSNTVGVGGLVAKQSFYASAAALGNALPDHTTPWSVTARPTNQTAFVADTGVEYDTIRLYSRDPGVFRTLYGDWSTAEARKKWLLGLNWGAVPSGHRKFGMSRNLAAFANSAAGSQLSNDAKAGTLAVLHNIPANQDETDANVISETSFVPLGVVRALHQYGNRFSQAELNYIREDAQQMYLWNGFGQGTENHYLLRLSNGYLMAQKFLTGGGLWYASGPSVQPIPASELLEINKACILAEGAQRFLTSFREARSPNYTMAHIIALLNLYDFANDTEVKDAAHAMLDHALAYLASGVYRGYIVDPYHRSLNSVFTNGGVGPDTADGNKNTTVLLNWLYWNQLVPTADRIESTMAQQSGDNLFMIHPALSSYVPPLALYNIANLSSDHRDRGHWIKSSDPIENYALPWEQRRTPDAWRRRVWRDREFSVGSMVGYFYPAAFHLQDGSRFGIAYRSNDRLHYIQAGHPYWLADYDDLHDLPSSYKHLDWWAAPHSPFMQVAHTITAPTTAILMFNIPQNDPWEGYPSSRADFNTTDRTYDPAEKIFPRIRRSDHFINGDRPGLRTDCALRYPLTMDEKIEGAVGTTQWTFLREGATYIGIRPLDTWTTPQQDTFWRYVGTNAVLRGGRYQTAFVVEVGTSKAVGGKYTSFTDFITQVQTESNRQAMSVTWGSAASPTLAIEYTNTAGPAVRVKGEYDTNLTIDTSDQTGKVTMFPKVYGNGVRDYSFTFEGTAWPRLDVRLSPTQPLITLESSVLTIKDPFTGGTTVVTMP